MTKLALFYRHLAVNGPCSPLEWLIFAFLLPLGWFYGAVMRLRALFYRIGWFDAYCADVPVISVGNLSVGGTGKTPVVDYLIRYCRSLDKRVAVVSRGYAGGKGAALRVVCAGQGPILDVQQAGDEPWLLARRNPEAIVIVAPHRARGVRHAVENLGAEVVLLDDGFQHLAVSRDFDLVLLDALRPFGNGQVLPAGLLREPISALRRGDLFVLTRCPEDLAGIADVPGPVVHCRHILEESAVGLDGEVRSLRELAGLRGIAFAGIAEPEGFFRELESHGLILTRTLRFSDHAAYDERAAILLKDAAMSGDYFITTEKDAVKLVHMTLPLPCFQVPLRLMFVETGQLEQKLSPIISNQR